MPLANVNAGDIVHFDGRCWYVQGATDRKIDLVTRIDGWREVSRTILRNEAHLVRHSVVPWRTRLIEELTELYRQRVLTANDRANRTFAVLEAKTEAEAEAAAYKTYPAVANPRIHTPYIYEEGLWFVLEGVTLRQGEKMDLPDLGWERHATLKRWVTSSRSVAEKAASVLGGVIYRRNANAATVGVFLTILSHKITRWDERQRVQNVYRLGHLLGAVGKIRDEVKGLEDRDDPEALRLLLAAMRRNFTLRSSFGRPREEWAFDLPPAEATAKQIRDFLATGKMPTLGR